MEGTTRFQPGQLSPMTQPTGHDHGPLDQFNTGLNPELFLWAAGLSVAASAFAQIVGKKHESNFIGEWAPTFLLLGVYSKLSRMERAGRGVAGG